MDHSYSVFLQGLHGFQGSCCGVKKAQEAGLHWELGGCWKDSDPGLGNMSQMVLR